MPREMCFCCFRSWKCPLIEITTKSSGTSSPFCSQSLSCGGSSLESDDYGDAKKKLNKTQPRCVECVHRIFCVSVRACVCVFRFHGGIIQNIPWIHYPFKIKIPFPNNVASFRWTVSDWTARNTTTTKNPWEELASGSPTLDGEEWAKIQKKMEKDTSVTIGRCKTALKPFPFVFYGELISWFYYPSSGSWKQLRQAPFGSSAIAQAWRSKWNSNRPWRCSWDI